MVVKQMCGMREGQSEREKLNDIFIFTFDDNFTDSEIMSDTLTPPQIDNVGKTKIYCTKCNKKCSGEVLRVAEKYFHKECFQCFTCHKSLSSGGFFSKESNYYCVADYQKNFGTKCAICNAYVEGEVISTMGNTYHQKCFTCSKCKQPFESGSKVS